jgi:glutaredoxin
MEKTNGMTKNILAALFGLFLIAGAVYVVNMPEKEINTNKEDNVVEEETVVEEKISEENVTGEEEPKEETTEETELISMVNCLKEKGVVIYGTSTCPHCNAVVESFGGREIIDPIFVECDTDQERCQAEMHDIYVPEIQISGEDYEESRDPLVIAKFVGCEI